MPAQETESGRNENIVYDQRFNITETGSWIMVIEHKTLQFIFKKVTLNFVNITCLMQKWSKLIKVKFNYWQLIEKLTSACETF
jgi:hypothetical protein